MSEKVTISLKDGKIRGIKERSVFSEMNFYSFYGVPYAEPPINDLRFKDPIKIKPWKCTRDGTIKKEGCVQFSKFKQRITGSEDCLYVNVHTPQLPQEGTPLKAVIAFIHLGGQMWGSPDPTHHGSPNFVMHHDIVYVTIGYRLNIFGFLDLKLPECSGNQGYKDVIMAFKWIKDNIHMFNGDPTNITAMGTSSGGAMLHLLMLSPAVNGLFHKAIITGQHMFNLLVPYRTNQIELSFNFAQQFGFKGNDSKKLLKFLKNMPDHVIIVHMETYLKKLNKNLCKAFEGGVFMETMDGTILPKSPSQFINSMERIPIIFGICDNESVFHFTDSTAINKTYFRQSMWGWAHDLNDEELEQMNKSIESFYNNKPENELPISVKVKILTDAAFSDVYDTLLNPISADLPSSVYVYKFQYISEVGLTRKSLLSKIKAPIEGTFHCDDVSHWAQTIKPINDKTKQAINNYTTLLTTFAKTGKPTYNAMKEEWRPTTPENPCYLSIDDEFTMIDDKLNGERFKFWDSLKKQFKRK